MEWTDYLKPHERTILQHLDEQLKTSKVERRKIYDKCRKRMERDKTNGNG